MQKAIAISPKFSAFFSVLGSGFIIYDIVCSHYNIPPDWWRKKESESSTFSGGRPNSLTSNRGRSSRRMAQRKTLGNSAYYRLMLAMSTSDFVVSFAWFCTTWPMPKDENVLDSPSERIYGNIGTRLSCDTQGLIIQLGIITPFYNALLALYYYLTIRREWKERDFKCKIEYAGHFVSISWGFGTAIVGLVMGLYNNSNVWCWIAPYPFGCGTGPNQTPCVRGVNSKKLRWIFYYGPLWIMICLVALFMSLVYFYVRDLDKKMNKYTRSYRNAAAARNSNDSGSGELTHGASGGGRRRSLMQRTFSTMTMDTLNEQRRQRRNERSKAVANQGLFYAGTFALVWVPATIVRAMQLAGKKPQYGITFLFAVFTPSQGFFNFLVYIRPRLIKYFEQKNKLRKGRRNSRNGGSFNSDILHVSGVSGGSSSNEVIANDNMNRDTSIRSDLELSEAFMKPKPDSDTIEPRKKTRFATDEDQNQDTVIQTDSELSDQCMKTKSDSDTIEPKKKTRFEEFDIKESRNSTKVRSVTDDKNFGKVENGEDAKPANSVVGIAIVDVTLDNGVKEVSFDLEANSMEFKRTDSEETIDPALLSTVNQEVEKEESPTASDDGVEVIELHNATIDLATGEVITKRAQMRVIQP